MTEPSPTRADRGPALSPERITAAAVELLDTHGLEALSTRRLATALGVRSPTLYWHVSGKAELLDLVAEAICADAFAIDAAAPWRDQLASGMRQYRELLLRHRDAAVLLRLRPPLGPHRLGHTETTVRILADAGFPDRDVAGIATLLNNHVLDSVTSGRPPDGGATDRPDPDQSDHPHLWRLWPTLASITDQERFELGAEVLLDGLERRLAHHGDGSEPAGG